MYYPALYWILVFSQYRLYEDLVKASVLGTLEYPHRLDLFPGLEA